MSLSTSSHQGIEKTDCSTRPAVVDGWDGHLDGWMR